MAAGSAEPVPPTIPEDLLRTIAQESKGEGGKRGPGRQAPAVGKLTAPDSSPCSIDHRSTCRGRNDAGHLRDACFRG